MPSVICPSCRHPVDFDTTLVDTTIKCPNCGTGCRAVSHEVPEVETVGGPAGAVAGGEAPPVVGAPLPPRITVSWTCASCGATNPGQATACAICRAPQGVQRMAIAPPTDGMAIASLIMGLIACVPILPQALAVAFGWASLRKIKRAPDTRGGVGLAWAGLCLGLLFGSIWCASLVGMIRNGTWLFNYSTATGPGMPAPMTIGSGKDDSDFELAEVGEAMDRVGRAMKAFSADAKRLPTALLDLAPSYARPDELVYADGGAVNRRFHYVVGLDPAVDDPNTIVVYTDPLIPPPPEFDYRRRYSQPDKPEIWKKGRAPRGIKRMVLQLNWEREVITLAEFDRRMDRERMERDKARARMKRDGARARDKARSPRPGAAAKPGRN